jgi:hypothetical protein
LWSQTRPRFLWVSFKRHTQSHVLFYLHARPKSRTKSARAPPSTNTHMHASSRFGGVDALLCALRGPYVYPPSIPCEHSEYLLCAPDACACAVQRLRALHLLIQFVVWSFVVAFVVGLATLPGTPRYRRTRHAERLQGRALYIVRPPTHPPTTKQQPNAAPTWRPHADLALARLYARMPPRRVLNL